MLTKVAPNTVHHDERIQNRQAWEVGLVGLPDATEARNVILSDDKVREFVSAAYAHDESLGLLINVLAVTGMSATMLSPWRADHGEPVAQAVGLFRCRVGLAQRCLRRSESSSAVA